MKIDPYSVIHRISMHDLLRAHERCLGKQFNFDLIASKSSNCSSMAIFVRLFGGLVALVKAPEKAL